MKKKYELLKDDTINILFNSKTLYRIKALRDFGDVKAGDLGGYVEKELNLTHEGNAWVSGDAHVYGDAWVSGDAHVSSDNDYSTIHGFGPKNRTTTFFVGKDKNIYVNCGRFYGTLEEFKNKIKKTHGDTYYAKEYLMIADLMEFRFNNR